METTEEAIYSRMAQAAVRICGPQFEKIWLRFMGNAEVSQLGIYMRDPAGQDYSFFGISDELTKSCFALQELMERDHGSKPTQCTLALTPDGQFQADFGYAAIDEDMLTGEWIASWQKQYLGHGAAVVEVEFEDEFWFPSPTA